MQPADRPCILLFRNSPKGLQERQRSSAEDESVSLETRTLFGMASVLPSLVGGMIGLLFAWLQSPFYTICSGTISGEWANCARVFLMWLPNVPVYWPMVAFGILIPRITFYAVQLLRTSK